MYRSDYRESLFWSESFGKQPYFQPKLAGKNSSEKIIFLRNGCQLLAAAERNLGAPTDSTKVFFNGNNKLDRL